MHRLFCLIATVQCFANQQEDIEIIRQTITHTLAHASPESLPLYQQFCDQYQKLVFDFFDKNNNFPLGIHIHAMERNLGVLAKVIALPAFSSVRTILTHLYPHLAELVATAKSYLGSRNYISFALSVRKFKYLLPYAIRNRGEISLLWSLRHRLLA